MLAPLLAIGGATLSLLGARADSYVPAMVFPVAQGAQWEDTFGAPRTGHRHQGEDLMAPKFRPLVACFDGTIRIRRSHGTAGNWITLHGENGWTAEYMHINNDTPGTTDNNGGDRYAFAPGLKDGDTVRAGQFLAYVGDSGNAEGGSCHCHFELSGPTGTINPALALRAARIIGSPQTGIALGVSAASRIASVLRVTGTVLAVFPGQSEVIVKVTQVATAGGTPTTLRPARIKRLQLERLSRIPALAVGTNLTAEGQDLGRGYPLRAATLTVGGVTVPEAETVQNVDTTVAVTLPSPSLPPAPPPMPEVWSLDNFDRGIYRYWRMDGNCFGNAPESSRYAYSRVTGWKGYHYLSTAHPFPGDNRIDSGFGNALSPEFPLTHTHLRFLIGGGNWPNECCFNLIVDGNVVRSETGNGSDQLEPREWDISEFIGKRARLQVRDTRGRGPRGYLLLDEIEMYGLPAPVPEPERPADETVSSEIAPLPGIPPRPTANITISSGTVRPGAEAPALASVTLPDGTILEGRSLVTLEATGYGPADNGPWGTQTALGTEVGYGTVAVDPTVIPLRTRLWVEGYGFCIALDTGGAIKGKRIDLGFNNEIDAGNVGRRKVRVLILK